MQQDMFAAPSRPGPTPPRKPMSAAQKAMAAKPSVAELRRSVEAIRPAGKPDLHREFPFRGWMVSVFDSPYAPGLLLVCAARPNSSPDGPARVALTEEVGSQTEADAWIERLIPPNEVVGDHTPPPSW